MAVQVERRTIDVVPDSERHGTSRDQFTLWFGANMQITAIVDGALAVVFGADALWAIIGSTTCRHCLVPSRSTSPPFCWRCLSAPVGS